MLRWGMPTDLPFSRFDLTDPAQAAAYVQRAFEADDPFLIVLALKEIGTARRVPVALDENPMLSEVLRVMGDLGLRVEVKANSD